jgi:hypothetical protein
LTGTNRLEIRGVNQLRALRCGVSESAANRSPRDAKDDFFCLRFGVWYPSIDCAYRTLYRSCPGCLECEQGRFNLKRHRSEFTRTRRVAGGD